jgi:hypothetical protein
MIPKWEPTREHRFADSELPWVMERQNVTQEIGAAGKKRIAQEHSADDDEKEPGQDRMAEKAKPRPGRMGPTIHDFSPARMNVHYKKPWPILSVSARTR